VLLTAFYSMICRTTLRSMVLTYLTLALLFVVPLVFHMVLTRLAGVPADAARWLTITSPFFTVATFESQQLLVVSGGRSGEQLLFYLGFAVAGSALLWAALHGCYNRYCQFRHDHGM